MKAWRPRLGSAFEQQVSGPAKCVFYRLLALADEDGVAYLARGDPHDGLARLLEWPAGATRRTLRRWVDELVAHGCLELEDGRMRLTAFHGWQGTEDASVTRDPPKSESSGPQIKLLETRLQIQEVKPAELFETRPGEKRREEKREEIARAGARARETTPSPSESSSAEADLERVHLRLQVGYADRYLEHFHDAWVSYDANHRWIRECARWAVMSARSRGQSVDELVREWLDAAFMLFSPKPPKWEWLAEDPAGIFERAANGPKARELHEKRVAELRPQIIDLETALQRVKLESRSEQEYEQRAAPLQSKLDELRAQLARVDPTKRAAARERK